MVGGWPSFWKSCSTLQVVFKLKLTSNGEIEYYKAHIVAKGYNQKAGIDHQETFSPVAKLVNICALLTCAAQLNWPLYHLNVNNSFINGDLIEEVCMQLPPDLSSQEEKSEKVCRLLKSL